MSTGLKRWKPYPAYKDSGVEWLGQVPEGWEITRLKFCVKSGFQYGANIAAELDDPNLPRYIRITDMNDDGTLKDETFRSLPFEEASPFLLRDKDILLARSGATVGKSFIYHTDMGLSAYAGYLIRIATSEGVSPYFLYTFLNSQAYWQWIRSIFIQATIQNVSAEKYANFVLTTPPLHEQQAIAAFLDKQCAQIDSLIEKKQRMLDLIDEKRRAAIAQAVTRGLDPTVPMKDSGVEWLGMVPEGWGIKRLGVTTQFIQTGPFGSQLHSEDYIENGTPVINPSHIQNGKIVPNYQCSIDKYNEVRLQRHKLTLGDVVFARRGEMGRCAEILSGDDGYICGTGCLQIRFKDNALSAFFASYLQTEFIRDYLKLESVGSTMDNLNTEILSKIPIPLPPLPEQQAIADYLDAQCAAMDSQRKNLEKSIELLREYRASLITHAVTGKIDVRDIAPLQ